MYKNYSFFTKHIECAKNRQKYGGGRDNTGSAEVLSAGITLPLVFFSIVLAFTLLFSAISDQYILWAVNSYSFHLPLNYEKTTNTTAMKEMWERELRDPLIFFVKSQDDIKITDLDIRVESQTPHISSTETAKIPSQSKRGIGFDMIKNQESSAHIACDIMVRKKSLFSAGFLNTIGLVAPINQNAPNVHIDKTVPILSGTTLATRDVKENTETLGDPLYGGERANYISFDSDIIKQTIQHGDQSQVYNHNKAFRGGTKDITCQLTSAANDVTNHSTDHLFLYMQLGFESRYGHTNTENALGGNGWGWRRISLTDLQTLRKFIGDRKSVV